MKILFICKHNRFRSKVAEAIFNKINKNKNEVRSVGISLDLMRPYICKNVRDILKEKGIEIKDEKAHKLNKQDLKWADKIIIVANNVPGDLFKGKTKAKIEVWKISDADENDVEEIKRIIYKIERIVKKLIR